jgi:hypothetical protein
MPSTFSRQKRRWLSPATAADIHSQALSLCGSAFNACASSRWPAALSPDLMAAMACWRVSFMA